MPKHIHPTPFIIQPPAGLAQQRPELHHLSRQLAHKYASRQVVTEQDLRAMGSALWRALSPDTPAAFDAARAGAGAAILSVIVESGAADVQALPWETLYHPTLGFLGKHPAFTLTRRTSAAPGEAARLEKGLLRVLLFTCLPDDVNPETKRLNVEEEQAQVQEALLPWIAQGQVRLEMPDDGRLDTLKGWLNSFEPHVLFLSGHEGGAVRDVVQYGAYPRAKQPEARGRRRVGDSICDRQANWPRPSIAGAGRPRAAIGVARRPGRLGKASAADARPGLTQLARYDKAGQANGTPVG